jgi:hypothetical protein
MFIGVTSTNDGLFDPGPLSDHKKDQGRITQAVFRKEAPLRPAYRERLSAVTSMALGRSDVDLYQNQQRGACDNVLRTNATDYNLFLDVISEK